MLKNLAQLLRLIKKNEDHRRPALKEREALSSLRSVAERQLPEQNGFGLNLTEASSDYHV